MPRSLTELIGHSGKALTNQAPLGLSFKITVRARTHAHQRAGKLWTLQGLCRQFSRVRPAWRGGVRAETQPTASGQTACSATGLHLQTSGTLLLTERPWPLSCGLHPPGRSNSVKLQRLHLGWPWPSLSEGLEGARPGQSGDGHIFPFRAQRKAKPASLPRFTDGEAPGGRPTCPGPRDLGMAHFGTGLALALGSLPLIPAASEGVFQNVGIRTRGAGAWAA